MSINSRSYIRSNKAPLGPPKRIDIRMMVEINEIESNHHKLLEKN